VEFDALHEGVLCPTFVEILIDFRKRVDIAEGVFREGMPVSVCMQWFLGMS
jgi:hypothetical protein